MGLIKGPSISDVCKIFKTLDPFLAFSSNPCNLWYSSLYRVTPLPLQTSFMYDSEDNVRGVWTKHKSPSPTLLRARTEARSRWGPSLSFCWPLWLLRRLPRSCPARTSPSTMVTALSSLTRTALRRASGTVSHVSSKCFQCIYLNIRFLGLFPLIIPLLLLLR